MICFYHSADLDGHCSGAIVKYKYPECEMIGYNYGDEFPWDKVKGQDVIMVDVCLQPFTEHMPKLEEKAGLLIYIDHHVTEIDEYNLWVKNNPDKKMVVKLDENFSACELVWDFFFGTQVPLAVRLLGRYDVWDHAFSDDVMPFQWGMRVNENTLPDNTAFWSRLLGVSEDINGVNTIIDNGHFLLKYRDAENAKYIKACAFDVEFEGLKFVCINRGLTNSQIFDTVWDEDKYDGMLTFCWRKGSWTVSMYGTKGIDLGAIAKKHGGGGHKQACGFQCDELPFKLM